MTSYHSASSSAHAFGRRSLLKGALAAAGVAALPTLSACSSSSKSGGGEASGVVSFGSNAAVPEPKGAYQTLFTAAKKATGLTIDVNWVDHNTFQQNITTYLQGNPQDVFNWFAGERMQYFASQGLASNVNDVWTKIGGSYTDAMKAQSKGADGNYYFVPFDYYPWAVFYSKSLWASKGYTEPTTWDEYIALAKKMKTDGLIPISFTDKDGWPAMGTFDYLNMRINGYDFHINLMRTGQGWNSSQVAAVFDQWKQLIPYYSPGFLGLTWQEGANQILNKQAGMMVLGLDQIGTIFTGANADDLGFFAFPEINSTYGQDSVEAPIDGFMVAKSPKNSAGATKLLEYLGTATAQQVWLGSNPADIATASGVDTSKYTKPQTSAISLINSAKHLSQFMDRDTLPSFADPVMLPAIQKFLSNPGDAASILANIDAQAKTIWATNG
ncbi:carbohydrate ABC transporter substrate-binding protein [Actinospica sp.]|uniref:ABC transporter substrate-binding protein n=1 Tax=Actinospica sp. TaxID=1872142 RepID=UPI002C024B33|nr:carbohydrate ABC transporter substrate-binding protein [Actinospica sp.]HWG23533.1 carbohydrate ABC transporter substrate-binding protein [Actinospica sp.]